MSEKKIIDIIGLLLILTFIYYLINKLKKKTDTKLYSDEAIKELQDDDKLRKLDEVITEYHKKGKWNTTALS